MSNSARKNRTVGEIVNLMSVDIQRFQDITTFIMLFWSAPLQVSLSIYFLWRLLGIAVIAGLFILIALVPLNSWLSVKMRNYQVWRASLMAVTSACLGGADEVQGRARQNDVRNTERHEGAKALCLGREHAESGTWLLSLTKPYFGTWL